MTREDVESLLERHKASFARRDAEALALDHAESGTFESPAHGVVQGRPAIRDVYVYWFSAFPDLELTWQDPVVDGLRAAVFWSLAGTAQGPFFGLARAGTRVAMTGAADYRFDNGSIQSVRHIFDFSGLLIRTGVLKTKPE